LTRGLFVTGTDTAVGKTVVACALLRALRRRGVDAVGMKPVETGVGPEGPLDAIALRDAAGSADPLELVCPQRYALPAAPSVAAAAEGRVVDLVGIEAAFRGLAARHDCVIAEGAGGLLVPLTETACMADLARSFSLPLLVVTRGRLGTINHTLLTLEAAHRRRLPVAGVVASHGPQPLSPADRSNLDHLRRSLGGLWVGELLPLPGGSSEPPEEAIELDALLRVMRDGAG
jgi:dethiobiotin synthetase